MDSGRSAFFAIGFWLPVSLESIRHPGSICNADCNRTELLVFHEFQTPDKWMKSNHPKSQDSYR